MKVLLLLGFVFLSMVVRGRALEKCEFAKKAKELGLDGYEDHSIGEWVCLVQGESNFDTSVTNHNDADRSTDYGPFQINDRYWCNGELPDGANQCGVDCSELLGDDIRKSVECAKKIVSQQGIEAWVAWQNNCQGQDFSTYVQDCDL
ncbi:lysozyme C-like [Gracilinanus agilis]|uniref:lysozyme C-like n=1 Tax=Gracilinanus agilis TaxID=191870 RepID=UPI001CFD9D5E|nr:lysozyme C-like [Gracilinanus agilis]